MPEDSGPEPIQKPLAKRTTEADLGETLLLWGAVAGFLSLFLGLPAWLLYRAIEENGVADTIRDAMWGFSPLIAVFIAVFAWGGLNNLAAKAADDGQDSTAKYLGILSGTIGAVGALVAISLMITVWGGNSPINDDCPWLGARC